MTNEIVENYPITPDLLDAAQSRRRWNFGSFKTGTAMKVSNWENWKRAAQAARMTAKRKNFRFSIKWVSATQTGLIVRVE